MKCCTMFEDISLLMTNNIWIMPNNDKAFCFGGQCCWPSAKARYIFVGASVLTCMCECVSSLGWRDLSKYFLAHCMTNFCSIDPPNPFENQKKDYFASALAAKPSLIYLYYNSLCLKMFLVTYDQLMNHARASREALMNGVGTYVKINKDEKTSRCRFSLSQ